MDFRERIRKIQTDALKAQSEKEGEEELAAREKARVYGNALKIHEIIVNTIEPTLRAAQGYSIYRLDVIVRSDQRVEITKHANAKANEAALWRAPESDHKARLEYVGDPDAVGITRTFAVGRLPLEREKHVMDAFTKESVEADVLKFVEMIAEDGA